MGAKINQLRGAFGAKSAKAPRARARPRGSFDHKRIASPPTGPENTDAPAAPLTALERAQLQLAASLPHTASAAQRAQLTAAKRAAIAKLKSK